MNRKFVASAAAMIVMAWCLSLIGYGPLLGGDYAAAPGIGPPAGTQTFIGWLILAQTLFAIAFAWVYLQGKEDKPWLAQGVRFGIAIAFLTVIPIYLIYHLVKPVPLPLAVSQLAFDTLRILLMGIVVAWINREGKQQ